HQKLNGTGTVLFLADDGIDLVEHTLAERQPGIDPLALLADHARPQHQAVRDDFGLLWVLLQDRHEIARQAHRFFRVFSEFSPLAIVRFAKLLLAVHNRFGLPWEPASRPYGKSCAGPRRIPATRRKPMFYDGVATFAPT